jgi:hypothetical protein
MDERERNELVFEQVAIEICQGGEQLVFGFVDDDGDSAIDAARISEDALRALEGRYYRLMAAGMRGERAGLERAGLEPAPTKEGGEVAFDWYPRYEYLTRLGWPWRVAVYIAWSTMPKKYRVPETQDKLAVELLGLTSDRVIMMWKQRHPQIEQIIRDFAADPLLAHLGEVMSALTASAANPSHRNYQDRKVFLEMTNKYRPQQDVTVRTEIDDASDLSRLDERAEREKALLVRKMVKGNG